jgi:CheY-like chemotaxis protein
VKLLSESRVLVVDDTEANVDVLVQTLRGEYRLSVALDGESALRAIEKRPPDLILLDIMMPGLDRFAVCRHIRGNERGRTSELSSRTFWTSAREFSPFNSAKTRSIDER